MSRTPDPIKDWLDAIKGRVCYPDSMKVYAPTCYGKCEDVVEELIVSMNKIFGGSTIYEAKGSWSSDSTLETEPIKVIEVGHNCTDPNKARQFARAVRAYAKKADQKAMAIHHGSFYIASSPELLKTYLKNQKKTP